MLLEGLCELYVEMIWLASGAIVSFVCRRGCRSQRQAIEDAFEGISDKPWTSTKMPAMVWVCLETVGEEVVWVPWRGFVVAAMVGGLMPSCYI